MREICTTCAALAAALRPGAVHEDRRRGRLDRPRRAPGSVARAAVALVALTTSFCLVSMAQIAPPAGAAVRGRVSDELGASVTTATVTLSSAAGAEFTVTTDGVGRWAFSGVPGGTYTLRVSAPHFVDFSETEVVLRAGERRSFNVALKVRGVAESTSVTDGMSISVEPDENAGATVLRERDLDALPDDAERLAAALAQLAGPGAGPGGVQFYIDGFSGGRLPPKDSIREIRINSNPFSAEYERLGLGRIEIFTKPGTNRLRGAFSGAFGDESLNARDPLAPERADEQTRRFGGNVSGPIGGRASFFLDVERREADNSSVIAATVLDAALSPVPFFATAPVSRRSTTFSPRVDVRLSENNTLVFRYSLRDTTEEGTRVGGYALASRAVDTSARGQTLSVANTRVLGPTAVSETRVQVIRRRSTSEAAAAAGGPALNVFDAFLDGSAAGRVAREEDRFEVQQNFLFSRGPHAIKTGARVRGLRLATLSTANYVGTFSFAGDVERDPVTGLPVPGGQAATVTSIEQYRRTLLGLPGYRPSQFTINAGDPFASVTRFDVGVFAQDDWRVRSDLSVSYGVRYQAQTNAGGGLDFAPRVGVAYGIGGREGRTLAVVRAGFGVFFEQVDEELALDEVRFDGVRQLHYVVARPGFFPAVPPLGALAASRVPVTVRRLEAEQTPYSLQGIVGVETGLPADTRLSVSWVWTRGIHLLRSRNVNAPLPGTGLRPLGEAAGNVFVYESSGVASRRQLRLSVARNGALSSLFANYTLSWSRSDTDGPRAQPADPYDLSGEYGRAADDIRHYFAAGGSFETFLGVRLSPFVEAYSGIPYNVTIGQDLNGDTVFVERPSFAYLGEPGAIVTPFGLLDPTPDPSDVLVPRNAGDGPLYFRVDLAVSRTFDLSWGGDRPASAPGSDTNRYTVTIGARASNLFNRLNYFAPSGVLLSPGFGYSSASDSGRRVELELRFRF